MDDSYKLSTPEQVDLAYDVAGLGTRSIASIVDTLVQFVVGIAAFLASAVAAGIGESALRGLVGSSNGNILAAVAIAVGVLLFFLVTTGYYIFFELVWNGESPGKRT